MSSSSNLLALLNKLARVLSKGTYLRTYRIDLLAWNVNCWVQALKRFTFVCRLTWKEMASREHGGSIQVWVPTGHPAPWG